MSKNYRDTTCTAGELMNAAVPYGYRLIGQNDLLTEQDLIMTSNIPGEWKGPVKDSGLAGQSCVAIASHAQCEVKACTPVMDRENMRRSLNSARKRG